MTISQQHRGSRPPFTVLRFWASMAHDLAAGCAVPTDTSEFWPGVVAEELPQWQADPTSYEATWIN